MKQIFPKLLPAPRDGGFRMDGYWVWCGSPIKAREDGRYHLFSSRWPSSLNFSGHWTTNSQIVRASADRPEGPYRFDEVVLPWRHRKYFDGLSTHCPAVTQFQGVYYLFYTGITYDFDIPVPERQIWEGKYPEHLELYRQAWLNKRIGLATSQSIFGPWTRLDKPLLETRPGHWDAQITSNPTAVIRENGFTVLVYKSRRSWDAPFQLGVATAPHPAGPYIRVSDEPIFPSDVEDPFVWWQEGRYHLLMKDFSGATGGEEGAGAYASSLDGIHWERVQGCLPYSRTIQWNDGSSSTHGNVERVSLLMDGERPTHLFAAISNGVLPHWQSDGTRNICIPLATD